LHRWGADGSCPPGGSRAPMPSSSELSSPWTLSPGEVFRAVRSDPGGLTDHDVAKRRDEAGPNRLAEAKRRSPWLLFLSQFKSLLILLLIGAAILALVIGEMKDAIVVAVVVIFNALLGFIQE